MASFLKASCASKRTKTAHEHFEALLGSTEDDRAHIPGQQTKPIKARPLWLTLGGNSDGVAWSDGM